MSLPLRRTKGDCFGSKCGKFNGDGSHGKAKWKKDGLLGHTFTGTQVIPRPGLSSPGDADTSCEVMGRKRGVLSLREEKEELHIPLE